MRNQKIELLKFIDHWLGSPICILLSLCFRACHPGYRTYTSIPSGELPPKTILIVKFFGLGSITLTSSLIANIRHYYKETKIVFLTFKDNAQIIEILSLCDEALLIDTKNPFRLVRGIVRAILFCWRVKIDVVMDLEFYSKFSTLMSFLSGARWRMGFYIARFWRNSLINVPIHFNYSRHILEIYGMFAGALLITDQQFIPVQVSVTQEEKQDLASILMTHHIQDFNNVIAINIHASDLALCRRWPLTKFVNLVNDFLSVYPQWRIILTGVKSEKGYSQNFLALLPVEQRSRIVDLTGELNLKEFLTLLSQLPIFITNDTGPFHLAKLADACTISLWGPSSVDVHGPYRKENERHRVVYKRFPCSPCIYLYRTEAGFFCQKKAPCMDAIDPLDVMALVHKFLNPDFRTGEQCRNNF